MKKIFSSVLAAAMVVSMASVSAFAANTAPESKTFTATWSAAPTIYNEDGDTVRKEIAEAFVTSGNLKIDPLAPGSTFYIPLNKTDITTLGSTDKRAYNIDDLETKKLWANSLDKDTGSKLIKSITVQAEKSLGGDAKSEGRTTWLKIVTNDTTSTSEQKFEGTVELKGKKDVEVGTTDKWSTVSGDKILIPLTIWVSNEKVGNDSNPGIGDRVVIEPDKNETNTIVWGDDRAALTFESNDDAGKFYARLNTKNDSSIWSEYADPVDADLWFYDFVASSTIPATSRATLTLGIPWDDDDDYAINPEDAFIYEKDSDGKLIDVTSKFTYSEDDAEIPGWSIKTRTLGTYIVSDTELDLDVDDEDVSEASDASKPADNSGVKPIPDTGSSDMVNVAVVAGIVSLAAAGAVAFRKAK